MRRVLVSIVIAAPVAALLAFATNSTRLESFIIGAGVGLVVSVLVVFASKDGD